MGGSSSEEAAELVATIRGEHVVMKSWFNGTSTDAATLREKYGQYPALWKEVLNWPGWKEARKAYLKFNQVGADADADADADVTNRVNDDSKDSSSSPDNIKRQDKSSVPSKRRSRWGSTENNNNGNDNGNTANKRRSRWGRDDTSSNASAITPIVSAPFKISTVSSSLPGHYGPVGGGNVAPNLKPLPGLGLPGMPTNLTPQQQEEMKVLQGRLREINEKLDNLEVEAARVDALPREHRERSPSPPPGTSCILNHLCDCVACEELVHSSDIFPFFALQCTDPTASERILELFAGDSVSQLSVKIYLKNS
jgi:hypothetical protein